MSSALPSSQNKRVSYAMAATTHSKMSELRQVKQHTYRSNERSTRETSGRTPLDITTPTSPNTNWQTADGGRKKRRKSNRSEAVTDETKSKKRNRRRLRPPKSAAVVVTLLPEAVDRGLDYGTVFKRARRDIDTSNFGTAGARTRLARTGARILEFPGAEGSKTADKVADKLRELFAEDSGVRITRPIKCAELRVAGLDDSVTADDIREAIASGTGCTANTVRVGTIRPGPGGTGSAWVQCPIEAAKSLADSGRLLVGWSSAKIIILDPKPARCYKCMSVGHTRPTCKSDFDCSGLCFRCGQTGHQAATCTATPHCMVCAAAQRPANHYLGREGCKPLASEPKKVANQLLVTGSSPIRPPARQEEVMETT